MSDLADVLDVMHTSGQRFRTLQASGREWRHRGRLSAAFNRVIPKDAVVMAISASTGGPMPDEQVERWKISVKQPDLMRAEFAVGNETVTAVFHGDTWWGWSPSSAPRTNAGRTNSSHGAGPGAELLDPSPLLPALELEVVERTEVLGRPAFRVRALPVSNVDRLWGRHHLHSLGSGADEYELLVDASGGFLLRTEARLGGALFNIVEMTELVVDGEILGSAFDPPAALAFDDSELVRHPQLMELPALVEFTVFVFEESPRGIPFVVLHSRDPDRGTPPSVLIVHTLLDRDGNLWLTESGEPMPTEDAVGEVWHQEDEFTVGVQDVGGGTTHTLVFERAGTHLRLSSAVFSKEELVDLARRLVPMPTDPPRLAR